MITVIGKLVIEFAFLGIHAIEPIHTPPYFVNYIRNPVWAFKAVGIAIVAEGFGVLLKSKHHLIDGICGGCGILQAVAGVVPSASHVDILPGLSGMIHYIAIFLVAVGIQKGIKTASVLPQIIEYKIGSTVIHSAIDGKIGRARIAHTDVISARGGKF